MHQISRAHIKQLAECHDSFVAARNVKVHLLLILLHPTVQARSQVFLQ